MKETICKSFGFLLTISIKNRHAFLLNQNGTTKELCLQIGVPSSSSFLTDNRKTISDNFRFFLNLFIKQIHAFLSNQNYFSAEFDLPPVFYNFLWLLKDNKTTFLESFGIFLRPSFSKALALSIT
jgi:hypothetical protein